MIIRMKLSCSSRRKEARSLDRDFVVEKLCELLAKLKSAREDLLSLSSGSGSLSITEASSGSSIQVVQPLMNILRESVDLTTGAGKEILCFTSR